MFTPVNLPWLKRAEKSVWCQKGYIGFTAKSFLTISDKYNKIYPSGSFIIILEKDLLAAIANFWHTHELEKKFIYEKSRN